MKLVFFVFFYLSLSGLILAQTFEVERLAGHVNSDLEEISPILSEDGQTLLFTRIGSSDFDQTLMEEKIDLSQTLDDDQYMQLLSRIFSEISGRRVKNPVQSRYNQDIYIATQGEERFSTIDHPDYPLNNALPNSVCSVTPDPNQYVIANQFYKEGGMSAGFSTIRRTASGSFEFPKAIEILDFYTDSEEVGFSMSPDGNAIIMSLDRDDSYGDLDLYVSFRIEDHKYSIPLNLGPVVNSAYREIAPYVSKDNNRLFFSSNRNSKRDFDIYTAQRQAYSWQTWADLKRLPEPINSTYDDSQPFFVEMTNELFFISKRNGNSDIYRVSLTPPKVKEERQVAIKGKIIDAVTKKPIRATLNYGPTQSEDSMAFFNSFTGHFTVNLIFKNNYRFSAEKRGYLSNEVVLDPEQFKDIKSNYEMVIELHPIKKLEFIEIGNLQFIQSKASLLQVSIPELNRLYRILKKDKYLNIRIEGHTDNVGDHGAKVSLSKARVNTVKEYLVSKGISAHRIEVQGFGDTRPLNSNTTEGERRKNRRVEVRIINKKK